MIPAAMTRATQTIEDIVRPLAERTIPCPKCRGTGIRELIGQGSTRNLSPNTTVGACPGVIPDPRFASLSCECVHSKSIGSKADPTWRICQRCGSTWADEDKPPIEVEIDASAGAILRAIQACGLAISLAFIKAPPDHRFLRDTWLAVWPWTNDNIKTDHVYADTPEEALAHALVSALAVKDK